MAKYTITLLVTSDDDPSCVRDSVTGALANNHAVALDQAADGAAVTVKPGHENVLRAALDALESEAVQALDTIRAQPLYAAEHIAGTAYNSVNHIARSVRAYLAHDFKA